MSDLKGSPLRKNVRNKCASCGELAAIWSDVNSIGNDIFLPECSLPLAYTFCSTSRPEISHLLLVDRQAQDLPRSQIEVIFCNSRLPVFWLPASRYLLTLLSLLCAVLLPTTVFAELSVYLDCKKRSCDGEFIRRELALVDFVRDPKDAQVHALITKQRSASGRRLSYCSTVCDL